MSRQPIVSDQAPWPGGAYSQAMAAGGFIYTAGSGPHDPQTQQVIGSSIEEQTLQVLKNLEAILAAGGAGLEDVIKVTVHLQNLERDFAAFNETYEEFFHSPYPARTTVGSALAGILVEIDVVAYRAS